MKHLTWHFSAYFITALVLAAWCLTREPLEYWFLWFVVGWCAPLALHSTFVMGLFTGGAHIPKTDSAYVPHDDGS
ncbi:MAG: 2TM domain-containing protein [Rhodospirillales bacterium]